MPLADVPALPQVPQRSGYALLQDNHVWMRQLPQLGYHNGQIGLGSLALRLPECLLHRQTPVALIRCLWPRQAAHTRAAEIYVGFK
jgi:hypothetical protein